MQTKILIKLLIIALIATQTSSRIVYPDGLWPMNSFGEFSTQNQEILAYYDFNRDRFVDILTCVHSTTHELRIYLYNQELGTFIKKNAIDMGIFEPVTAIAADLIQDGMVDIVLTMQLSQTDQTLQMMIYSINCTNSTCTFISNSNIEPITTSTLPTVMQIQGKNVLIYTKNNKIQSRYYSNGKFEQKEFVVEFFVQPTAAIIAGVCTDYHDIYYLDYNGDCLLDLIIHCNTTLGLGDIQFYKGNKNGLFAPDKVSSFGPRGRLLRTAITDINFDGLVDVIELVGDNSGLLQLQIHYNTATKSTTTKCSTTLQDYFPFQFISSDDELNAGTTALKIQRISLNSYAEWVSIAVTSQNFYLRPGDINNDGYMDLIIDGPNRALLLINEVCNNDKCGTYNPKFMQTWSLGLIRIFTQRNIDGMTNYNNKICSMSFFDMQEDGRLDLMSNLCSSIILQPETKGSILAIYNSLPIDAFFIKITVLENLGNQTVKTETMDNKLNIVGAHADFYVTALNGEQIPSCGNQLSHPGKSLQLPYIHTGLGRTNNYVESLSIAISSNSSYIMHTWSPIVPNSQLIIVPGPKWLLQTYIQPTKVMSILLLFVIIILVLMGLWVIRLTKKQKMEDKQNQDSFYAILR